ncbi:efflux RND transporter periplasmic adaptor subunit [Adhaeretor mobilis]|nr:efflux RND transporter periplasmic adaptor subunit [Adhaeretor mobilis]
MHSCRILAKYFKNLLFACLLITLGCRGGDNAPTGPPMPEVSVARPVRQTLIEWDEYTGRLAAVDSVEVRPRVGGYLREANFSEGEMVEKGDLLFVIDRRPFETELRRAKAQVAEAKANLLQSQAQVEQTKAKRMQAAAAVGLAETELQRAAGLVGKNAISKAEYDTRASTLTQARADFDAAGSNIAAAEAQTGVAQAAIETAEANVHTAELQLGYAEVKAPITGRVGAKLVTEGNLVNAGSSQATLLTTIVALNPIHCYFDANEQEFLKYVRLSQNGKRESSRDAKNPVYLALVDEQGFPHLGHMDFVDNRVDPNTGTMRGRAIFLNDDGTLTPGLFARVRLPGSASYEAILLPDEALGNDLSEQFVNVVGEGNKVSRQRVVAGPVSHGLRIVREGLTGDERVVIRGGQNLRPGMEVKTVVEELSIADKETALPDEYEPVPRDRWITRENANSPEISHDFKSNSGK